MKKGHGGPEQPADAGTQGTTESLYQGPRSEVLTVPEVCKILRLGRSSVYQGLRTGAIPGARYIGRTLRVMAMRGVPARSIQELAGHKSLTTTMRYMHLTPQALQGAISKLDEPVPWGAKTTEKVGGKLEER